MVGTVDLKMLDDIKEAINKNVDDIKNGYNHKYSTREIVSKSDRFLTRIIDEDPSNWPLIIQETSVELNDNDLLECLIYCHLLYVAYGFYSNDNEYKHLWKHLLDNISINWLKTSVGVFYVIEMYANFYMGFMIE